MQSVLIKILLALSLLTSTSTGVMYYLYKNNFTSVEVKTPAQSSVAKTKKHVVTVIKKPDGTTTTINDSSEIEQSTAKNVTVKAKTNYSIGSGVSNVIQPNYKSYKGYYIEGGYRVGGDVWIKGRVDGEKNVSMGLEFKF